MAPVGDTSSTNPAKAAIAQELQAAPCVPAARRDGPGGRYYVSYAWADETDPTREAVVDRLCAEAAARGRKILRDKTAMRHGDSIVAFMDEIAQGDLVYIFLSDKYLKSAACLYELHNTWRESKKDGVDFKRRTRLYVLGDAKISKPEDRVGYAHYWQAQHDRLDDQIHGHDAALLGESGFRTLRDYREFAHDIADILALINDTLQPKTFEDFVQFGFEDAPPTPSAPIAPPSAAAPAAPCAAFRGRDEDVAEIRAALLSASPVAVLAQGPPGIGKTEITKAVANDGEIVARFGAERRWFVALETATTAALMQDAVARALGADPAGGFAAVLATLAARPGLLVLDNLETPWSAERAETERTLGALARVEGVALLASFRGRDRVEGPAWALEHEVERLDAPFDAQVFQTVAARNFSADPHLAGFLIALGGVPLALDLVARRARLRPTLAALWKEWERRGAEVAARPGEPAGRETSLPRSIEFSLAARRLTAEADRLFRFLGALPAGLAGVDGEALLGEGWFAASEVLLALGLAQERGGRLDLLAPIREYARRSRPPQGEDADLWRRHYLKLAEEVGEALGTKAGFGGMDRLTPEFANISAALAACLPERLDEALAAVHGFGRFAYLGSQPTPIFAELAAECERAGDGLGEANCIRSLGDIALRRSQHDEARQAFQKAIPLFQQVGSVLGEANCIRSLGNIALARSQHDEARQAFQKAIPLFQQVGDVLGEANCIQSLGDIALARSQHDEARQAFQKAIPLYQQVGSVLGEANCIQSLGNIALARSQHDEARQAYQKAIPLYQHVGSVLGEANCIRSLGNIALRRSQQDEARQAFQKAIPLFQQVGSVLGEANCIKSLGNIALERSQHDEARQAYQKAIPLYQQVGDVLGEANCIKRLGDIALAQGDLAAARAAYEKALPMHGQVGNLLGEGAAHLGLGDVARAEGDVASARAEYETALDCCRRFGDPASVGLVERRLAALASGRGGAL